MGVLHQAKRVNILRLRQLRKMMRIQTLLLCSGVLIVATGQCPENLKAIYADMHDGDKKEIVISGTSMTIKPSGNNQTWVVKTELNRKSCRANVDFNVPGKPRPPPVNLTAALWYSFGKNGYKTEFEFTDPSGKLAPELFPLNRWVELEFTPRESHGACPPIGAPQTIVYADMHDGDKKEITLKGRSLTIKPSGNNQTWTVRSEMDSNCKAVIDFNVPGKPGPPPVNLTASLLFSVAAAPRSIGRSGAFEYEFTDPSGTLAAAHFPLNHWVEISKPKDQVVI